MQGKDVVITANHKEERERGQRREEGRREEVIFVGARQEKTTADIPKCNIEATLN